MRPETMRVLPLLVLLAACGDPDTEDGRGYTKAPLEHPSVLIRGEEPTRMAQLGEPNRVRAEPIELPEQTEPQQPGGAEPQRPQVELPAGVTQEMVAQGQTLYAGPGNCFACHAPTGAGTPLAPALNDATWINIDGSFEAIEEVIRAGVPQPKQHPSPMPARGGGQITDEQVRQIAAYIYTISR